MGEMTLWLIALSSVNEKKIQILFMGSLLPGYKMKVSSQEKVNAKKTRKDRQQVFSTGVKCADVVVKGYH